MKVEIEFSEEQFAAIADAVAARMLAHAVPSASPARGAVKVPEVARMMGVSNDTIYRMVSAGRLARVPGTGAVRIPVAEVERVMGGAAS
jgi:excisionase family DNA binding protein